MQRSRPLLDFGAGMLFGLSVVVALFAAMEEDDVLLSHRLLLAAAAALIAAFGLQFAARTKRQRAVSSPKPPRGRDATGLDAVWTADGTGNHRAADERALPGPGTSSRATSAGRSAAARPNLNARHTDLHGPATADGETRRL